MPASIKRRIRRYVIYALIAAPFLFLFHNVMMDDKESLCDRGEMYGKECYE